VIFLFFFGCTTPPEELFLNSVWDEVNKGLLNERLLLDLLFLLLTQEPSEFIPDYIIYYEIPQSQCIYVANY